MGQPEPVKILEYRTCLLLACAILELAQNATE
jgi:hypothetical protein